VSYDGCDYNGWQRQKIGGKTVQGTLEKALTHMLKEPISVCSAGRTDAGVHALSQELHFWCHKDPKSINFVRALNGKITPDSLVIKQAWLAPHDFHALGSAIGKTYKYLVLNRSLPSALRRNHITHVQKPLNLDYLNQVSEKFLGTHDYSSFQTTGSEVKTTVKTISSSHWLRLSEDVLEYTITGDGFLKQMVRNIVGTQFYMTRKNEPPDFITKVLKAKDRQAAKDTAPAQGLYLYQVKYPKGVDKACLKI
jgi:tRNA pseudouridine38-40 synthase